MQGQDLLAKARPQAFESAYILIDSNDCQVAA